ncbi:MAG: PQQ-like beta-propeller repeat protein [Verrucomicrobiales bacterium]|nr:PQQ-like beta-propeller repeat protein [Verrucomicrobiales bacterium]
MTISRTDPFLVAGFVGAVFLGAVVPRIRAEAWPAYRGPTGDGVCHEAIDLDWPAGGPPLLWRKPLTDGFSSVTVAGDRVFTLIRQRTPQDRELCVALRVSDGTTLWSTDVGPAGYDSGPEGVSGGSDGPRSTPVFHNDRVYVYASHMELSCLDAATGAMLWDHDLIGEFGGVNIPWQSAASPLICEGAVLVNCGAAGQSLLGFDPVDGALLWKGGSYNCTQATPVVADFGGRVQAVFLTRRVVVSVAPANGEVLWAHNITMNATSTAASPVTSGDLVFVSSGYGTGAAAIQVAQDGEALAASEFWRKRAELMSHWMTPVEHEGHVYGQFGYADYTTAPLQCIDVRTGIIQWTTPGFGHGGLIRVGDQLLAMTDRGYLARVEATPTAYHERQRFRAVNSGVVWNAPAISDGRLYVRSTKELAVYDVSLAPPAPLRLEGELTGPGFLRLRIGNADATPVDPGRLGGIEVLAADDPSVSILEWEATGIVPTWVDGAFEFEETIPAGTARRFYRVVED